MILHLQLKRPIQTDRPIEGVSYRKSRATYTGRIVPLTKLPCEGGLELLLLLLNRRNRTQKVTRFFVKFV
jgi:hypothetical protein